MRVPNRSATRLAAAPLGLASVAGCFLQGSVSTIGRTPSAAVDANPPPVLIRGNVYKPANSEGPAENVPLPVKPDGLNEPTPAGLKAFAEYRYQALDYLYQTGEGGPYLDTCAAEHQACQPFVDGLAQTYADGGWMVGSKSTMQTAANLTVTAGCIGPSSC